MRYLKATIEVGLRYTDVATEEVLTAFCDTDSAGDFDEHKSMSGYVLLLSNETVSWMRLEVC